MEKPGPDASSADIAEWLEEDFWDEVADGLEEDREEQSTEEDS